MRSIFLVLSIPRVNADTLIGSLLGHLGALSSCSRTQDIKNHPSPTNHVAYLKFDERLTGKAR
jgi:hypothetical protein